LSKGAKTNVNCHISEFCLLFSSSTLASELAAGKSGMHKAPHVNCWIYRFSAVFQPERTKGKTQRQNFSVEQLGSDAPICAAPADGIAVGG